MDSMRKLLGSSARAALRSPLVVAMLIVTACAAPAEPTPVAPTSPSAAGADLAGLITVGDRKMYLECRGTGSPTVVLESGFRDPANSWAYSAKDPTPVYAGTAAFTRVCAYDRPGTLRYFTDDGLPEPVPQRSRSDPAPMPRTGADVVKDLHDLLRSAGVPGPYVLVGHSMGGLLDVMYAQSYPGDVAALVLVDGVPPTLRNVLSRKQWKEWTAEVSTPVPESKSLIPGYVTETYDSEKLFDLVGAAGALPKVPVLMLAAASSEPADVEYWAAFRKGNQQFADRTPGARLTVVPGTMHYIHHDRPDAVIAAIRSLV